MSIVLDSIEETSEYKAVIDEVTTLIEQKFPLKNGMHQLQDGKRIWAYKKQLLAERGIEWKTPAEMNPNVIFCF